MTCPSITQACRVSTRGSAFPACNHLARWWASSGQRGEPGTRPGVPRRRCATAGQRLTSVRTPPMRNNLTDRMWVWAAWYAAHASTPLRGILGIGGLDQRPAYATSSSPLTMRSSSSGPQSAVAGEPSHATHGRRDKHLLVLPSRAAKAATATRISSACATLCMTLGRDALLGLASACLGSPGARSFQIRSVFPPPRGLQSEDAKFSSAKSSFKNVDASTNSTSISSRRKMSWEQKQDMGVRERGRGGAPQHVVDASDFLA